MTVNAMAIPQTFAFSVGTIIWMASATTPDGMLPCNGAAVSRTTYSRLFGVIGTKFGVGDGSTTFNVPDLGGNVLIGYKSTDADYNDMGKVGGEKTHVLTIAELATHNHGLAGHPYNFEYAYGAGATYTYPAGGDRLILQGWVGVGSDTAHENRPPFVTSYAYIKT